MVVMAGLVPAIHALFLMKLQEDVDAGTRPGMTCRMR
jgi:hypothetical protein